MPEPRQRGDDGATVVGVGYLNARPLLTGLQAGLPAPFDYHLVTAQPARCAELLAAGKADAGLVPVASLADNRTTTCVPGVGIAAEGEVWSVLLVSRVRHRAIRRLAVHAASRSSAALAELLLSMETGMRPEIERTQDPLGALASGAEAAVVIGDPALEARGTTGFQEVDLAAWWYETTGLPFVFAVWGLTPGPYREGLAELLERSAIWGLSHIDRAIASANGTRELVREYLERRLRYRLGEREREGLELYLSLAAERGILPTTKVVWYEHD